MNAITQRAPVRAAGTPQGIETFRVRRGIAGWHLVPALPRTFPLLARLYGHSGEGTSDAALDDVRQPLEWSDLNEGMRLIREVAHSLGIGVRVCGDIKRSPTVQLWLKPRPEATPAAMPFAGLKGDAAAWSVSDFYPRWEAALTAAIQRRSPFDTEWFSAKKALQSGRVTRQRHNGKIRVHVNAYMDDWPDLVDSALHQLTNRAGAEASGGFDALEQAGICGAALQAWMLEIATYASGVAGLGEGNSVSLSDELPYNAGYAAVAAKLEALACACEAELQQTFDWLVDLCGERVASAARAG